LLTAVVAHAIGASLAAASLAATAPARAWLPRSSSPAASRFFRIKRFGACINCQRHPASSIVSGLPLGTFRLGIMITIARVFFVIFDVVYYMLAESSFQRRLLPNFG
jgi:hypothetical protein